MRGCRADMDGEAAMAAVAVTLDATALDRLQNKLEIHAERVAPGARRGAAAVTPEAAAAGQQAAAAVQEIVQTYRDGISIAPHAESRPLIPLFAAAGKPVPPELQVDHASLKYDFYSVEVAFSVMLPRDQHPGSAELSLHLSDNVTDPARRTRALQLFPGRKDITLFSVDLEASVGIDADMKLSLPMDVAGLPIPFGTLSAEAKTKAGMVVGPFSYPICRAAIEVVGEQSQDMLWRYELASTLSRANTFKSILVLKVAQEAGDLVLDAKLTVTPYKSSWVLFKELLPPLSVPARLPVELARG